MMPHMNFARSFREARKKQEARAERRKGHGRSRLICTCDPNSRTPLKQGRRSPRLLPRMKFFLLINCCLFLLQAPILLALEPSQTLKVWPDGVQGPVNDTAPERVLPVAPGTKQVMRVEGITDPTL